MNSKYQSRLWVMAFTGLLVAVAAPSVNADILDTFKQWFRTTPQPPHPAVVRVVAPEGHALSMGSGSLIWVEGNYGYVISNWHVVRDAKEGVEVIFPDGFRSPAQVMKTDATWDLALLGIWRPSVTPIPLAEDIPQVGDRLSIAGYGQDQYRQVLGICRHYAAPDMHQPHELVEVSVAARQGDSGGPILNSQGELAGVLFGSGGGLTTGTHIGRVKSFLQSVSVAATSVSSTSTDVPVQPAPSANATMVDDSTLAFQPVATSVAAEPSTSRVDPPAASAGFVQPAPPQPTFTGDIVAHSSLPVDVLEALEALDGDTTLPFEELAANDSVGQWTHRVARTSDRIPWTEHSPNDAASATLASPGWKPLQDPVGSQNQPGGPSTPTPAPDTSNAPFTPNPSDPRQFSEMKIPVNLPVSDTQAFLAFIAVLGAVVYALPRGNSKISPGAKTTG